MARKTPLPARLDSQIRLIRGQKVMLDGDLAQAYGVTTGALNQAVRRNRERFPEDFGFQLSLEEVAGLRSQIVISKPGRGGRRYLPWAFTEHGSIMAASMLSSPRAVEMSVFVVRAFVRLRSLTTDRADLAAKLAALERKVAGHDEELKQMFAALRALLSPPQPPRRRIGFAAGGRG